MTMISLVVPVFDEEDAIPIFHNVVRRTEGLRAFDVEIVFVNDGSRDGTAEAIRRIGLADPLVRLVDLTRNFGKEAALLAGLERARGEAVIPIDVDLQDPIDVIPSMIDKWRAGADVVLAKRIDRSSDSRLKRDTAALFYRLHNRISTIRIEENVGDFRLIARAALNDILRLPERNLFMKGMLAWVGGRTEVVEYVRPPRVAGQSKFNGWKLWNFAIEGITSFSTVPLRIWTYLGLVISSLAFLHGLWMMVQKLVFGNPVPGYPSLIIAIMFLGGVQIVGIGVIGEYIGRIYIETKQRPRYLVREEWPPTPVARLKPASPEKRQA
ncbi:glycosyltransferase family 2 protein [Rubellimicrobium arenae]|uniref:glycosyltransferase family 2 protein n=1 Tax=Rubellimicrobium arenae TaxID=2817372 RepID=UPI001B3090F8|nr:glycosyltransferase family 2 protein [Rubellimicrobium arenae]